MTHFIYFLLNIIIVKSLNTYVCMYVCMYYGKIVKYVRMYACMCVGMYVRTYVRLYAWLVYIINVCACVCMVVL